MSLPVLILRYGAFAVVAVVVNLAVQRGVLATSFGLFAALVAGTAAGLVVKYLLDKVWIFDDRATGLAAHGRRFSLYTLMGVATTAIFPPSIRSMDSIPLTSRRSMTVRAPSASSMVMESRFWR